jgi:hypothetical protein
MSSGHLADTSQTVSTSEIQTLCRKWNSLTFRPDGVALMSKRLQLNLLDTTGRPDAFKGSSGRLHMDWFFYLGICKESSWTSSRNL